MSPLPVAYSNTRVSTEYIHPCNRGGQMFFRFPRLTGTPFVPLIGLPASSDLLSDCFDNKAAQYRDHLLLRAGQGQYCESLFPACYRL